MILFKVSIRVQLSEVFLNLVKIDMVQLSIFATFLTGLKLQWGSAMRYKKGSSIKYNHLFIDKFFQKGHSIGYNCTNFRPSFKFINFSDFFIFNNYSGVGVLWDIYFSPPL